MLYNVKIYLRWVQIHYLFIHLFILVSILRYTQYYYDAPHNDGRKPGSIRGKLTTLRKLLENSQLTAGEPEHYNCYACQLFLDDVISAERNLFHRVTQ